MNQTGFKHRRSWRRKFADALRGVWLGSRGEKSFVVHAICGVGVLVLAAILPGVSATDASVLVLCVAAVVTAELFNSAIERLAAAFHPEEHSDVGAALDIASGAVLACAMGAAIVGAIVLGPPLFDYLW